MNTILKESTIDEATQRLGSDAAFIRDEFTSAVERAEECFDASRDAAAAALKKGIDSAEELLRRGRESGQQLIDEATFGVKTHPQQAVALAFGAGALAGAIFGTLVSFGVKRQRGDSRTASQKTT
jgi:ElaB/YqjD/DUF883 family membrane-anchored ribosome-binding protein